MATTNSDIAAAPAIVEFTREESWADFDAIASERLGLSGEEFLRRLDAGEFEEIVDDPINHPWVGYLAQLSAYVR
jgi:hypothetical protein